MTGVLMLHLRSKDGIFGVSRYAKPRVEVNGSPVPAQWGWNEWRVPAGAGQLSVKVDHITSFGRASSPIMVPLGQPLVLHYSPSLWRVQDGRIGDTPQPFPGKIAMTVILSVGAVVVVLGILGILLALLVGS